MLKWKRAGALFLTAAMFLSMAPMPAKGDDSVSVRELETKTTGTTGSISVKEVEFDFEEWEENNLKIEFYTKVRYKNPAVSVTDETGKAYDAEITEKDWDELELWVDGLSSDHTYTIIISGIKPRKADSYGTLTIEAAMEQKVEKLKLYETEFKATSTGMEQGIDVEEVEFEWNKGKGDSISVDFLTYVSYKNTSVTLTDETGKKYAVEKKDWDTDDLEVTVDELKEGHTYKLVIQGIKPRGTKTFGTLTIEAEVKSQETTETPDSTTATSARIKKAEYDRMDEELELKFSQKVAFTDKVTVTVTDASGKKQTLRVLETEKDEITVRTSGIKLAKTFEITIKGVKTAKETTYGTLTMKITPELD